MKENFNGRDPRRMQFDFRLFGPLFFLNSYILYILDIPFFKGLFVSRMTVYGTKRVYTRQQKTKGTNPKEIYVDDAFLRLFCSLRRVYHSTNHAEARNIHQLKKKRTNEQRFMWAFPSSKIRLFFFVVVVVVLLLFYLDHLIFIVLIAMREPRK